ncbi:MAG: hypothetical protein KIH01_02490 [Candidatus Freyarchaeota archaeon]|nr:hypothetical protein [Candidatus Jordarchaeia archaeon]
MPKVIHPQKVKVAEGKLDAGDLLGKHVFHATEYVLAGEGGEWRVFKVKTEGDGFLRKVVDAHLVSSEEETVFVDADVDPSSNREILASLSKMATGSVRCIAYRARYQHVGLALFEPPNIHVHVVEVEPPPPKLIDCANRALREELIRRDMKISTTVVNILELVKGEKSLIMPCRLQGFEGAISLDRDAEKIRSAEGYYTLLGCPVTLATLREVNPKLDVKLVDMCPAHLARKAPAGADYYIVRCCKASIQGTLVYGAKRRIVALQWSPAIEEFLEALYLGAQKPK